MNTYNFGFLVEPTTPPVIGDASTLQQVCKAIGMLCFAPIPAGLTVGARLGITTGAYVTTNAAAANAAVELQLVSPYRLPAAIMPASMGATSSGTLYTAGGAIAGVASMLDDTCTEVLRGLDRPVVTKGCGIVAYLPAGVDVSSEMDAQIVVPVCNGQTLVIGTAVQDAMQGTYETPFSSAWAFAVLGGRQLELAAVQVVDSGRRATTGKMLTR